MDVFTLAWLAWIAAFAVIEGIALARRKAGDTLSEHIWAWFDVRAGAWSWRRILLLAGCLALTAHLVFRWPV